MVDTYTEVTRSGPLKNLGKGIAAIPVGVLAFLGSFVVLWKTEGCTDFAKVARESVPADAATTGGADGRFVSVTGALVPGEPVGDPDFVAPGPWISLHREVETFAWTEDSKSETEKKIGGREEKTTTWTYRQEWTSSPRPSSEFKRPEGHENPPATWTERDVAAASARVGAWEFDPRLAELPDPAPLSLEGLTLTGTGSTAQRVADKLYIGKGTPEAPVLGDVRVGFAALGGGSTVTFFGDTAGNALTRHKISEDEGFYRAVAGGRDEALASLRAEHSAKLWIGRGGGFAMMWLGLTMVFAPLHALADVLPFLGRVSRGLIGCVTFPVALLLSAFTTIISLVLHSWIAVALLSIAVVAGIGFWLSRKSASA